MSMGDVEFTFWVCPECRERAEKGEVIEAYYKKDGYYFVCKHLV